MSHTMKNVVAGLVAAVLAVALVVGAFLYIKGLMGRDSAEEQQSQPSQTQSAEQSTQSASQTPATEDVTSSLADRVPARDNTQELSLTIDQENSKITLSDLEVSLPDGMTITDVNDTCQASLDVNELCYLGVMKDSTSVKGTVFYENDVVSDLNWNADTPLKEVGQYTYESEDKKIKLVINPKTHQGVVFVYGN